MGDKAQRAFRMHRLPQAPAGATSRPPRAATQVPSLGQASFLRVSVSGDTQFLADASASAPVRHGSAGCWGARRRGDRARPWGSSAGGCLTIVRTRKQSLELPQRCWRPRGGRPNALPCAATLQNPLSTGTRGQWGEQDLGEILWWRSVSGPAESCSVLAPRPGARALGTSKVPTH